MLVLSNNRIAYLLVLASVLTLVLANVEKVIFTAPALLPIPQQKPSLADLRLPVLAPDASEIRTNLSRVFPSTAKDYASGAATWVLLDNLNPEQRYEFRVCWAAIVSPYMGPIQRRNMLNEGFIATYRLRSGCIRARHRMGDPRTDSVTGRLCFLTPRRRD